MRDDDVVFSINEERLSRKKGAGGFPLLSISEMLRGGYLNSLSELSHIYATSIMNPPIFVRCFDVFRALEEGVRDEIDTGLLRYLSDFVHFNTSLTSSSPGTLFGRATKLFLDPVFRMKLPKGMKKAPLSFVEHHSAHAASAFFTSGFNDALCITADEMGDGISLSVNACSNVRIRRVWEADDRDSFGYFYKLITEVLGFLPMRHEGKIMALAAYGDHRRVKYPFPFVMSEDRISYTGGYGLKEVVRLRKILLREYSKEDIASWLQFNCQEYIKRLARKWLASTGSGNLVLAGGFFANIKVNQELSELDEVNNIFVYPNMGDAGISHGAILACRCPEPARIKGLYWGNCYSDEEILDCLNKSGVDFKHYEDIEPLVAQLLAEDKVIARFKGRMEWGPRALGNRSVLYNAKDATVNSWLNKRLRRSEFMPFAPATLLEDAPDCYICRNDSILYCAEFMTICVKCTPQMIKNNPAVVHVDGTARPQLVRKEANPDFYRIISEYKGLTNNNCIINTSFNMHDEPIVSTPEDAIRAFKAAGLDYLAIGNFLVENAVKRGRFP